MPRTSSRGTSLPAPSGVSAPPFNWNDLMSYKTDGRFIDGLPEDERTFFAPYDGPGIHRLIVALLQSAQFSIVLNMYGYDDDEADNVIRVKAGDPRIYVQMSLDRSQSRGKHEQLILEEWHADAFGTSIAIGTSTNHAISHLKILIVDQVYTVSGSTNWSISGEQQQDNQLTISRNAALAGQYRGILDRNHAFMLAQMRGEPKAVATAAQIEAQRPAPTLLH